RAQNPRGPRSQGYARCARSPWAKFCRRYAAWRAILLMLNLGWRRFVYLFLLMNRIKFLFARISSIALLLFSITVVCLAQEQPLHIKYWLGMSRPISHLFEVTIEVALPVDAKLQSLDFQMPKWSPGRYAVFDFAKNVQEVNARPACPAGLDCTLPDAQVTRIDNQTWRVALERNRREAVSLMFSYKVFSNDLSGTFSQ